jgi:predicted protein tyrosine phosphatase
MKAFFVSSVFDALWTYRVKNVTHVVSFRDDSFEHPPVHLILPEYESRWLRFKMYDRHFEPDQAEYNQVADIVDKLLAFVKNLPEDAVVGFNCQMGISRSTAAALLSCVARYGFEEGKKRFWDGHGPCAPNQTMLGIADLRLGLDGKLVAHGELLYGEYRKGGVVLIPHRKDHPAPPNDPYDVLERDEDSE